ncbi:hypothetical protein [Risungbinella massiliensis]|uniref:hypothetical protein n=1 Tax=Risungbinella massiliensis TaxID=1329796 RepID=UPI00164E8A9F|nr:hypothetical protein [Risungbinella massiliensis]
MTIKPSYIQIDHGYWSGKTKASYRFAIEKIEEVIFESADENQPGWIGFQFAHEGDHQPDNDPKQNPYQIPFSQEEEAEFCMAKRLVKELMHATMIK